MTFKELCRIFYEHNEKFNITRQYEDKNPLIGYVRFKQMPNWIREFSEEERTYKFYSSEKYFIWQMCGNSLYASCLGYEEYIRLDNYLGQWEIEECWIEEKGSKD